MDETPEPTDTIVLADIPPLNIATLTLGEMADAEAQSGRTFDKLLVSGSATRRLLALWVHERRTSAQPRSWRELRDLRPFGAPSSTSPRPRNGRRAKSNA